ncbi:hypothetical protein ACT17_14770 [Mycolicibacterium conceptionense]|uniref:Uncharacterized protein n=1 Tax=Mycolicibacterium conceptionense TaxID=451644 RepID=A0A0J8U972_9MYCO|nr:hypothetical protein [Mycolicibacterium conceptionense]KMV17557.1 hypothetical protein ACT17_14770 [Mycolicibacterium conceptionense]
MSITYDIGFHHETNGPDGKRTQFIGWRSGFTDGDEAMEYMRSMFGKPASALRMNAKEREGTAPDLDPNAVITCAIVVELVNGYQQSGSSPSHYRP